MEFLHGSDPVSANQRPLLELRLENLEINNVTNEYLVISFQRNLQARGSLYVELSDDLVVWQSGAGLTEILGQVDNGDGTATVTVRLITPPEPTNRTRFIRLRGE